MRALIITLLALSLTMPVAGAASAVTGDEVVDIGVDAVVFRPLGALTCLVGAVFFAPAAALTYPTGKAGREQAKQIFIDAPWESTFERTLGEW